MIRFRDDHVYNQVARWVAQRRVHTIERYFASYPEQLKLAGVQDLVDEIYQPREAHAASGVSEEPETKEPETKEPETKEPETKEPETEEPDAEEPEAEKEIDWERGLRVLKTAGKIVVGVGGVYLLWRVSRRWRRRW